MWVRYGLHFKNIKKLKKIIFYLYSCQVKIIIYQKKIYVVHDNFKTNKIKRYVG